jgi:hypothetical protein
MNASLLATCQHYLSRPGRGRGPGNCQQLREAGCECDDQGRPTIESVEALLRREQQKAGYLWHVDIIRINNGGRTDLPHTQRIGMAIVAVLPRVQSFWNEHRNRRWQAVAYCAIGRGAGPGTHFGEYTTEQAAFDAARTSMIANGWHATYDECVTAGAEKLKADGRFKIEEFIE